MADQEYLYQFRLILLGDSTVGKSSLLRQFKEGTYFPDISLTVGVDFHAKLIHIRGQPVKLQLWDTAGQDRFRAIVRAYYRNAVGGLLVFDITNRESFANLSTWLEEAQKNAEPHKPVFVLVGNKTDQEKQREVLREDALKFAKKYDMEYFETSAKSGSNVDEVFQSLAQKIFTLVSDGVIRIQEGWDGVKKGIQMSRSHPPLRNGSSPYSFNSTHTNLEPEQHWPQPAKKKCC